VRKINLSENQLDKVIKLRDRRSSWLRIERETDIPRRVAQRAYKEWQNNKTTDELKEARVNVASELYREHVETLVNFGYIVASYLDLPKYPGERMRSREYIDKLLGSDAFENEKDGSGRYDEKKTRRRLYQNRLLLDSLESHTREDIQWEKLENWKYLWDECIDTLGRLQSSVTELVKNVFSHDKSLTDRIKKETKHEDALERIVKAYVDIIWTRISRGDKGVPLSFFELFPQTSDSIELVYHRQPDRRVLKFKDRELAQAVLEKTELVTGYLLKGTESDIVILLEKTAGRLREVVEYMERELSPMVLRARIVRSARCNLCPV
jgi:hypothetical protein